MILIIATIYWCELWNACILPPHHNMGSYVTCEHNVIGLGVIRNMGFTNEDYRRAIYRATRMSKTTAKLSTCVACRIVGLKREGWYQMKNGV